MLSKQLMIIKGSAAKIMESLSQAGFVRDINHESTYRAELNASEGVYIFQLPYEELDGIISLDGEAAFFEGVSFSDVPEEIQVAAMDRWYALRTRTGSSEVYAYSPERGDRRPSAPIPSRSVESAINGSMVQDFADMQRLGQDMERMKTESQLIEEGLVNDPIQH